MGGREKLHQSGVGQALSHEKTLFQGERTVRDATSTPSRRFLGAMGSPKWLQKRSAEKNIMKK